MWFIPLTSVSRISTFTINKTEQKVKGLQRTKIKDFSFQPQIPHPYSNSTKPATVRSPGTKYALFGSRTSSVIANELNSKPFLPYHGISKLSSFRLQDPVHTERFGNRTGRLHAIVFELHSSLCSKESRRESEQQQR